MLSIPDWSITPFAESRNRNQVAKEIEAFNSINRKLAVGYNVQYITITAAGVNDETMLAPDGLHPSAKEYSRWAGLLSDAVQKLLV